MRFRRWARWWVLSGTAILPAFILQCDKAALNLQRGFYQGLGAEVAVQLVDAGLPQ